MRVNRKRLINQANRESELLGLRTRVAEYDAQGLEGADRVSSSRHVAHKLRPIMRDNSPKGGYFTKGIKSGPCFTVR